MDVSDSGHSEAGDHSHTNASDGTDLHSHDHAHGSAWTSRMSHGVSEFFGLHSHDPADSIDEALEASVQGIRAVKISFAVLMVTAIIQAGIVWLTGSVALLADTIHNFSDALTAVPLFIAFKLGRRAKNRRYTYGYGRAEDIAGLFIVLMILLSAIVVAWQSIDRLLNPRELDFIGILFAAGIIGFIGNELVALYRIRVGRAIRSAALVADGLHARVDGLTSLAVAAGAAGVWLGFDRADPIVGIIVAIAILGVLQSAGRDIFGRLMDRVDPELVDTIEQTTASVDGVRDVNTCQVRWMGHRLRADISIAVDPSVTVAAGHEVTEAVKRSLHMQVRHLDTVLVHVNGAVSENAHMGA